MRTIIISIFLLPFVICAQNYKNDLLASMNTLANMKNYSLRVCHKLYLDGNTTKPFQESSTILKRSPEGVFYKESDGPEYISNAQFEIYLDEQERTITARRKAAYEKEQAADLPATFLKEADTLLSLYDQIKVLSNTASRITYQLHLKPDSLLDHLVVSFDKAKKMLVKIQYVYKHPMPIAELKNSKHKTMMEVTYENQGFNSTTDLALFSEKKYLVHTHGKIKPAPKYAGYTLNLIN